MVSCTSLPCESLISGKQLLGGALIGLAASFLIMLPGRATSVCGMIGSLLGGREGEAALGIAFLSGLFIAPSLIAL